MNDRVKELRKFLKLNQEAFGNTLGVGKTAISKIESGERNVTDTMIKLICTQFAVSEDWLRFGQGNMFPTVSEDEKLASLMGNLLSNGDPFKKKVIATLLNMSEEEWTQAKKFIHALIVQ